jgi:molybdopterin-guanine dinucleotide biosynthesis protein A
MGVPKATLPFGSEVMLQRVLRLLGGVVRPLVVVTAPDQKLPNLPDDVLIARDEREDRGPLEGLLAGLSAIESHADAAYVTSCDVPLLVPAFVERMIAELEDHEVAVPTDGKFHHPLAAAYRTSVLPHVKALLHANRMRPIFLFDEVKTRRVPVEELKANDPELTTLMNLNRPTDYFDALNRAGLEAPADIVKELNDLPSERS